MLTVSYFIINLFLALLLNNNTLKTTKNIEKLIKKNTVTNYISESEIKYSIIKDSRANIFFNIDYIIYLIQCSLSFMIFLIPIMGQGWFIYDLYLLSEDKKKFNDEYINSLCSLNFINSLNSTASNICADLRLIGNYTSGANVKKIKTVLSNISNPYHTLAFKNFETLVNIIKEQRQQLLCFYENTGEAEEEIKIIVEDYIRFINEINNKAVCELKLNSIDRYSKLLKSMTEDLKNNKY